MEAESLRRLDLCSAAFIRHYGRNRTKRNGTSQAYGALIFRSLVIHAAESTTIALACKQTGPRCSMSPLSSTRQSRSMAIRIDRTKPRLGQNGEESRLPDLARH